MKTKKRGSKGVIKKEHLEFLKNWLTEEDHVGKSFKYAYEKLIK